MQDTQSKRIPLEVRYPSLLKTHTWPENHLLQLLRHNTDFCRWIFVCAAPSNPPSTTEQERGIDWICSDPNAAWDLWGKAAKLTIMGQIHHQRAPGGGGAAQAMSPLLHHGYRCRPHWNTTGVKRLWWSVRDYGNNTLVKSCRNNFPHVDGNVNIPQRDDCTLCSCVRVHVCVCVTLRWSSNPVCAVLGPVEDRATLEQGVTWLH